MKKKHKFRNTLDFHFNAKGSMHKKKNNKMIEFDFIEIFSLYDLVMLIF
jgi:hypothetical protein